MKKLLVFLMFSCLIFSCTEDTSLDEFAMEESFINGRVLDDGGIYSDPGVATCVDYQLVSRDEEGCCVYKVSYKPNPSEAVYLKSPRGFLNPVIKPDGTYEWTVVVCRKMKVELYVSDGRLSYLKCVQFLGCRPPIDCCDVGFIWEYKEPGEIDCNIYAVALVIPSDECEWRITGVYSKQGSASIVVHEGGTTADITLCEIKNPTGPIGFGFIAENINGDCSTFNSGFVNP